MTHNKIIAGCNINTIAKNGLCVGCGTCISMCPKNSISMAADENKGIYIPEVDLSRCNDCGICYNVCPGHGTDFDKLNIKLFGKTPKNILIGNYLHCYIGYSADDNIRYNSASGGLVTQVLLYALESGMIDGALVTRMSKKKPFEAEPFIAKTREELLDASKSKYCPVSANIALSDIIKSEKGKKFAVVGLPCHIQGVRKAEEIDPELKNKIILHVGLFCNHTPNFWGTEILLRKIKADKESITKLDYRGEGWPGIMKICSTNSEMIINFFDSWRIIGSFFFYPTRCLMCSDCISELADISFGDAWLDELHYDKKGTSIMISKNQMAENILQQMKQDGIIELTEIEEQKVIESQLAMLHYKKKIYPASINLFGVTPKYNNTIPPDKIDYLLFLYIYVNSLLSSKWYLRHILYLTPVRIIRLYFLPFHILTSIEAKRLGKYYESNNTHTKHK